MREVKLIAPDWNILYRALGDKMVKEQWGELGPQVYYWFRVEEELVRFHYDVATDVVTLRFTGNVAYDVCKQAMQQDMEAIIERSRR